MDKKGAKVIKYILSVCLAAVLVWLAFRKLDWGEFVAGLGQTRWIYLLLFSAASILALVFRMFRWKALLKPVNSDAESILIWDANNISNVANIALPGSGEIIRCGYLSSRKAPFQKVLGTIVLERFCDVLAVFVLFILALSLCWGRFGTFFDEQIWQPLSSRLDFSLWWILGAGLVAAGLMVWLVFRFRDRSALCGKLSGFLTGLWQGFLSFASMEKKWTFLAYTVGIWTMYILMSFSIMLAMPDLDGLHFIDAVFISAVGNIASVVPVPGGVGAYHYLVAASLSGLYSTTWETGILYATLCHELHSILIILLGIISYVCLTIRKRK